MAAQQAELQLAGQLLGDRLRHEAAEARVDTVGVLAVQRLEQRTRGADTLAGAVRESRRTAADRDLPDVVDGEVVSGQSERVGHGASLRTAAGSGDVRKSHRTWNVPSTSTATSYGRALTPTAIRVCRPASPKIPTRRSEAPLTTCEWPWKSGVALT